MSELSQTLEGTNLCGDDNITPHEKPNQSPKDYFTLYIKPYRQIFAIYATLHAPSKLHTKKLLSQSSLPYQTLLSDIITSFQNFNISKLSNYIDELIPLYKSIHNITTSHQEAFRIFPADAKQKILSIAFEGVQSFNVTVLLLSYQITINLVNIISADLGNKKVCEQSLTLNVRILFWDNCDFFFWELSWVLPMWALPLWEFEGFDLWVLFH